LTKRLEKILSYIEDDEKVIDVGCDQALLSVLLAKRKIYSIASDLRENIIKKASENVSPELKKYITFRVGNGITLRDDEKCYVPVLAGMGTYLILDILKNSKFSFDKIITISNNNHDILRKEMNTLGYVSHKEEIIKEKGKYYNLIVFKRGVFEYTLEDLLIGVNHQNLLLLKEKNDMLIYKYKKILNTIEKDEDKENLLRLVGVLENYDYKESK